LTLYTEAFFDNRNFSEGCSEGVEFEDLNIKTYPYSTTMAICWRYWM